LAWGQIEGVFESNTGLTLYQVWPGIFRRMFVPSTNMAKVIDQHVYTINRNCVPSNFRFIPGIGDAMQCALKGMSDAQYA